MPLDPALRFLLDQGPTSVKELSRLAGKSESRLREVLKEHAADIQCKKNEAGVNVFWTVPEGPEADEVEDTTEIVADIANEGAGEATEAEPREPVEYDPDAPDRSTSCPFCEADEAVQTRAGPEGSFLGAARTCGECGKTYNVHTREEVAMPAKAEKAKRKPLNPQYKIDLKVDAVKAAGGKLVYEREGRQWVLTKRNHDPRRMTAKEFSIETPESLVAAIS